MGVIIDVPEAGLDLALYGDKSNILINYLWNQLQQIPQQFNEFSNRVYEQISNAYNFFTDKLVQYGIRNSLNKTSLKIENEYIHEIINFEDFQNANITMQRWIMANPIVREQYLKNNIEGYGDSYTNLHGNTIGLNNYDYRRVMDKVIDENEVDERFVIRYFDEPLLIGDRELNHYEKVQILNTWRAAEWLMEVSKFDFTAKSTPPVKKNI